MINPALTEALSETLSQIANLPGRQTFEIVSELRYQRGQKNGSLNRRSRLGSLESPKWTPYEAVTHRISRFVVLGISFSPSEFFGGEGKPDEQFPSLVVRHPSGMRYLVFWPAADDEGKLIPNVSRYFDENGRELDFETELAEYWKTLGTKSGSAVIRPSTVKLESIVSLTEF